MKIEEYAKNNGINLKSKDTAFHMSKLVMKARLHAGITQKELADRMSTKQPNISRAESGEIEPSLSFIEKVANATGAELVLPRLMFKIKN